MLYYEQKEPARYHDSAPLIRVGPRRAAGSGLFSPYQRQIELAMACAAGGGQRKRIFADVMSAHAWATVDKAVW